MSECVHGLSIDPRFALTIYCRDCHPERYESDKKIWEQILREENQKKELDVSDALERCWEANR